MNGLQTFLAITPRKHQLGQIPMDEKAYTEVQVSRGEVPALHWKEEKKKSGHMRVGKMSFANITPPHKVPKL